MDFLNLLIYRKVEPTVNLQRMVSQGHLYNFFARAPEC